MVETPFGPMPRWAVATFVVVVALFTAVQYVLDIWPRLFGLEFYQWWTARSGGGTVNPSDIVVDRSWWWWLSNATSAVIIILMLVNAVWLYRRSLPSDEQRWNATREQWKTYEPRLVQEKSFLNETVELDGVHYINCTFQNVTFRYSGRTPIQVTNNKFIGDVAFDSPDPSLITGMTFVLQVHALFPNRPIYSQHPKGNYIQEPQKK